MTRRDGHTRRLARVGAVAGEHQAAYLLQVALQLVWACRVAATGQPAQGLTPEVAGAVLAPVGGPGPFVAIMDRIAVDPELVPEADRAACLQCWLLADSTRAPGWHLGGPC